MRCRVCTSTSTPMDHGSHNGAEGGTCVAAQAPHAWCHGQASMSAGCCCAAAGLVARAGATRSIPDHALRNSEDSGEAATMSDRPGMACAVLSGLQCMSQTAHGAVAGTAMADSKHQSLLPRLTPLSVVWLCQSFRVMVSPPIRPSTKASAVFRECQPGHSKQPGRGEAYQSILEDDS